MGHSSNITNEFILTCQCPDMPKFATEAFSTVFPNAIHPVMLVGGKQILDEANQHPGTMLGDFLKGVSKNKEKFAYYVRETDQGAELWDLKKGIKIS